MHAKYALALVLVLQVSLGLCQVFEPSPELADKYNSLKALFYKRILNAYQKLQTEAAPLIQQLGEQEQGQLAKEYIGAIEANRNYQAALKVAAAAVEELEPLVDKARTTVLGAYETFLRPHIGSSLDDGITSVQAVLNTFMPAE